jgi:hypothetical protein
MRRGFQPPHNANQINAGFSLGRTSFANFVCNSEFFRKLFICEFASEYVKSWLFALGNGPTRQTRGFGLGTIARKIASGGNWMYIGWQPRWQNGNPG